MSIPPAFVERRRLHDRFDVHDVVATMAGVPCPVGCESIADACRKLTGLPRGFGRALKEKLGGTHRCTRFSELLANLPTAIRTLAGLRREDELGDGRPFQPERCHALESHAVTVRRYDAKRYRGAA